MALDQMCREFYQYNSYNITGVIKGDLPKDRDETEETNEVS